MLNPKIAIPVLLGTLLLMVVTLRHQNKQLDKCRVEVKNLSSEVDSLKSELTTKETILCTYDEALFEFYSVDSNAANKFNTIISQYE